MSTLCKREAAVDTAEWRAVVVDSIDEEHYILASTRGDEPSTILPTCSIQVPAADHTSVCILSWRWDTKSHKTSKNLVCAFRLAKRLGFRHLLVDCVSVDQSLARLNGDELRQQIVRFAELFSVIPVIAAYDIDDVGTIISPEEIRDCDYGYLHSARSRFLRTTKRPWIFAEIQRFRHNPSPVVYVGHNNKGGTVVGDDRSQSRSAECIPLMYGRSFARSVVGVLCGTISMTSVSDFRKLLPTYHDLLALAYDRWKRVDYLLTVALLSMSSSPDNDVDGGNNPSKFMSDLKRYQVTSDTEYLYSFSRGVYFIHLDGMKIAH